MLILCTMPCFPKVLLTDKVSENLITNFQDGRQVVGPLFSTPSTGPKGENGIISFASPVDIHSRGNSMSFEQNHWEFEG